MLQNSSSEEKLFLNTLPFHYPDQPVTCFFTSADINTCGLERLYCGDNCPANLRDIFPDLEKGTFVYSSFDTPQEGLCPLPVDFSDPRNANFVKRYYNCLIFRYFSRFSGKIYIRTEPITRDNQLWWRCCKDADYPDSVKFDRFTLKVNYDAFNAHPQLLLTFDRPSHISSRSMAEIASAFSADDPFDPNSATDIFSLVSKVLYYRDKRFFIDSLKHLRSRRDFNSDKAYPVISHQLRELLGYPVKENIHANPLADYFSKINDFYQKYLNNDDFRAIIPIDVEGFAWVSDAQACNTSFDSKDLLFGHGVTDHNPSRGLNHGPFLPVPADKIQLFCVFHEDDKPYARFLMKTIRHGYRNYDNSHTVSSINPFSGLQEESVSPDVLKRFTGKDTCFASSYIEFSDERNPFPEVEQKLKFLFESGKLSRDRNYMALYVSPIGKRDRDHNARYAYFAIKEALLHENIELQVIQQTNIGTINAQGEMKPAYGFDYTLQNMALAIAAKMGGMPWKFNVPKRNELVVGIGAFRNTELRATYIGSAFAFDNTGAFNSFEYFLKDEISELVGSIKEAIIRYTSVSGVPDRLVIHYYKPMSHEREFLPIENMLRALRLDIPVFVVSVNKTESSDFVLFDAANRPCYLPYSGRYVNLGNGSFLLCNNARYRRSRDRVNSFPFPVKLHIVAPAAPLHTIDPSVVRELIEQVYRFSRIYFKSVAQQHLPVSLKYPELVAEILPYFRNQTTESLGNQNLWFL